MLEIKKAGLVKRGIAALVDLILIAALCIGVGFVVSPMTNYDEKMQEYEELIDEYTEKYGIDTELTQEQFDKMTEEERDAYNKRVEEANAALNEDEDALELRYDIIVLFLFNVTVGILVAYLALDFAVPLLFGNGQTIGKKLFGIGIVSFSGNRINIIQLLVNSGIKGVSLWLVPAMYCFALMDLGVSVVHVRYAIALLCLINIICFLATKNRLWLHNAISRTVCADVREL